jgi:predicted acyl esterase
MKSYQEGVDAGRFTVVSLPEDIIVERDVAIKMRDGTKLRANVFRPDMKGPSPVVMTFTMYDKDAHPAELLADFAELRESLGLGLGSFTVSECTPFEAPDPAYWVPHGYVVVHVDIRGTGKSDGIADPFGEDTVADYGELIEWAGTQDWSNGRVALHGVSFLAISQWYAAAARPKHLFAIVPWEGVSDPFRDNLFHGGIPETSFASWWLMGMEGLPGTDAAPSFNRDNRTPPISNMPFLLPHLSDIEVPALICGSWSDQGLHTRGSIYAYMEISSEHKWLYTHGRGKWSVYHSLEAMEYQRKFLDYFLKGFENGMLEEPRVRVEVRKTLDSWTIRGEDAWPIPRTEYFMLHLNAGDKGLSPTTESDVTIASYDSTNGESLCFDFQFAEATEITGHMKLKLWVSTDQGEDMDIFVAVRKLDSEGREVHFEARENDMCGVVSLGWQRVSHRELDPEKSTPWLPYLTLQNEQRLEPGEIVPVEIEILPSSTWFGEGETLRLEIKGQDLYPNRMLQHKDLCNAGNHNVHIGGDCDSHLMIPVIHNE